MKVIGVDTQVIHLIILETDNGQQLPVSVTRDEAEMVRSILGREGTRVTVQQSEDSPAEAEESALEDLYNQLQTLDRSAIGPTHDEMGEPEAPPL